MGDLSDDIAYTVALLGVVRLPVASTEVVSEVLSTPLEVTDPRGAELAAMIHEVTVETNRTLAQTFQRVAGQPVTTNMLAALMAHSIQEFATHLLRRMGANVPLSPMPAVEPTPGCDGGYPEGR